MKRFFLSRLFLTKVIPSLFFGIMGILSIYGSFQGHAGAIAERIVGSVIVAMLALNLYLQKKRLSQVIGVIFALISFYLIVALFDEYFEFPDLASSDALKLLGTGLALFLSGITMGVLLILPFKKTTD